jgi:hypothetical protein
MAHWPSSAGPCGPFCACCPVRHAAGLPLNSNVRPHKRPHFDLPSTMIFAAETEERTLYAFPSEAAAVAACEGLDVEAATWLFWSEDGTPLEPIFTVPNKRGLFIVRNGTYHLEPTSDLHHAHLVEAVEEILSFECSPPLHNADGIKAHLSASKIRDASPPTSP